ncbi:MAG: MalY/PatB family protein [Spirochaetaceae bacterium]|nr:pyridoxal phosphate-dependent aminotransferase [Spirochaetaceae bacterium]MDT8298490.1 MalY/PatB family protein [Spirochaetaceae bacterium]
MAKTDFDFEMRIDRRDTSSIKWDWDRKLTGRDNLLPFWVADMDFRSAEPVMEALQARLDHGIFGYTARPSSLDDALMSWFSRRHGWVINSESILEAPGIVPFIHMAVRELTEPGESVVIQEPVYYPFRLALERNRRRVAANPLDVDSMGRWSMNPAQLEMELDGSGAKLLILCSPHNPVGRVWRRDELLTLADICRERGVTVISDEIHADLVHSPHRFVPWLSLPKDRLPPSIALVSATKSFNLPGLTTAYAVVDNPELRQRISGMLEALGMGLGSSSPLSYTAAEAAWTRGEAWLEALLGVLSENDALLRDLLAQRLPEITVAPLEGTYLEWLNMAALGMTLDKVWERLLDAGIWLSKGSQFGAGGKDYLRMNIAAPASQLEEGLEKMTAALTS